ncbi:MAG: hypothetical protein CVV13_13230 [Gammaproteobacteria bacterium HGW-Gammaproteobacteria-3]|jgi:predicted lipid-binding transport protein (Tim44 family)|nr:MAG: hypothetical protein CVV13_13230 [Gammaproteobacteria bacterium HGW-Gammaproteobacteria-3]
MNQQLARTTVSAIICASLLTGCATTQENQQAWGAGLGAITAGLATGLATGNVGYGIAAAVGGAAIGWGAVKLAQYNSEQVRSASQDQALYGFTPSSNATLVKLHKGTASPDTVAPGQQVQIASDYSLAVPEAQNMTAVQESWTLKKDGQVLFQADPQNVQRTAGGYAVNATIPIPKNASAGTYVVETRVQAGTSSDFNQAVFVVQ